jgi:DNA-directed RNA polymerase subunit E'
MGKIGITCRQPFLGADEWIQEEIKNINKSTDNEEKVEVKEKKKEEKVEVKEKKKEEKVEVKEK